MTSGDTSDIPSQNPARLTLILITGERVRLTASQYWQAMLDTHSLIFFALTGAVIGYLYPLQYAKYWADLPWWQRTIAITTQEAVLLLTQVLQITLLAQIARKWKPITVPVSPMIFLSLLAMVTFRSTFAGTFYGDWGEGWAANVGVFEGTIRDYIWLLPMEVIFCIFVVPQIKIYPLLALSPRHHRFYAMAATASPMASEHVLSVPVIPSNEELAKTVVDDLSKTQELTEDEGPAPLSSASLLPDMVWLAGERISMGKLRAIRAEEHYIRLIMDGGDKLLRYRIADAVALMPEGAGMQVHRSFWVAFAAIERVKRLPEGKLLLVLEGRHEVAVPRARRKAVEALLEEHRRWAADDAAS